MNIIHFDRVTEHVIEHDLALMCIVTLKKNFGLAKILSWMSPWLAISHKIHTKNVFTCN